MSRGFMFGQTAALSENDLIMIAIVTAISIVLITLFYKEMLVTSFDSGLATSLGICLVWVLSPRRGLLYKGIKRLKNTNEERAPSAL